MYQHSCLKKIIFHAHLQLVQSLVGNCYNVISYSHNHSILKHQMMEQLKFSTVIVIVLEDTEKLSCPSGQKTRLCVLKDLNRTAT